MSWNEWDSTFTPPFERDALNLRLALGDENVFVRDYDAARPDLFGDFCTGVLQIDRPAGEMPLVNVSAGSQIAA